MSVHPINTTDRVSFLLSELDAAGKRHTAQRDAIVRALVAHGGHPTVAEIFDRVREGFPMISQATVYNTVDTLQTLGAIVRLGVGADGHAHYDLDTHPHVNITCRQCGRIQDVSSDGIEAIVRDVGAQTGFQVQAEAGLTMYGICKECRRSV